MQDAFAHFPNKMDLFHSSRLYLIILQKRLDSISNDSEDIVVTPEVSPLDKSHTTRRKVLKNLYKPWVYIRDFTVYCLSCVLVCRADYNNLLIYFFVAYYIFFIILTLKREIT